MGALITSSSYLADWNGQCARALIVRSSQTNQAISMHCACHFLDDHMFRFVSFRFVYANPNSAVRNSNIVFENM